MKKLKSNLFSPSLLVAYNQLDIMASYHFTSPLSNGSPLSYKFPLFNCPLALKAGHLLQGRGSVGGREGKGESGDGGRGRK